MKKFILLVLLFVSPSFAVADTLGGLAGGAVGVGLGSLVGGGQGKLAAQVLLGIVGASAGSRMEDGTYGASSEEYEDVVLVQNPSYGHRSYGAHGYGTSFVCRGNPNPGMYPYPPGYCHDSDSGGYASYENLAERHYRKLEEQHRQHLRQTGYHYPHPSVATQAVFIKRNAATSTVAKPKFGGPTVKDYMEPRKVHSTCQTGNHGADGKCLLRFVDPLLKMQAACERNTAAPDCAKNPGKVAGDWSRLGKELIDLQIKEQGGLSSLQ